jgi:DDE superfamily endonuclease
VAVMLSMPQAAGEGHSRLGRFRGELHDCFTAWPDALFELVDGLSQPVVVEGVAHLSLAATARRGHGSGYAALREGRIDQDMIGDVLVGYRPVGWGAVFAVDTTTWARPNAHCSPGRGLYHGEHAKARQVHGQPIVAGWNFSLLAAISPQSCTWTAPLDIRLRVVGDDASLVAAEQIRTVVTRIGDQQPGPAPLFVLDAGYNPALLTTELAGIPAQIGVRIRNDRRFFTRAPQPAPRTGQPGRPRRHGTRFHCADPDTWPTPDATASSDTSTYGRIDVQAWHRLHPCKPGLRDTDNRPAIIECSLIRITVDRLPNGRRQPRPLWLWWAGPSGSIPDLLPVTYAYLHRFDIEHTFRFTKQTLGLTTPKIRTPDQAQRWAWLITAAYTQLRLATSLVADHRLPWQQPQPAGTLTPGRVRNGFGHLLPTLPNPTKAPKTTTGGPGRPPGRPTTPATRHPAQKVPPRNHPKASKKP